MDPSQLAALLGIGTPSDQANLPSQEDLTALGATPAQPPADISGGVTSPGQTNGDTAIPAPQFAATVAPGVPLPGTQSGMVKQQGFSGDKFAQVKKTQSPLDAQIERDRQGVEAEYAPLKAKEQDANASANSAIDLNTQAEQAKAEAMGRAKKTIADAYTDHENKSTAAYAQARTEAEGIKAQYRAALADYNAAHVNPAQLWDNAGAGGRFGLMATAFVHDFLGAKGIKTSAMDTINAAIQRNIDTQLENIKHKREAAQGFKELWDMQRAQSATDQEARDRMFGFHLQGLTNGIDAEMSRYDSGLAQAKGAAAKATLQQAMVKNDMDVQAHIDAAANARAQQRVAVYGDQLRASTAMAEIQAKKDIASGKIKAPADPRAGLIIDTSESGGNTAKWRFRPGISPEQQKDVMNKVAATNTAARLMRELQTLQAQANAAPDGLEKTRLMNELQRKSEASRNEIIEGLALEYSGKAVSDKERQMFESMLPDKTWFTNGSNVGIIAQTLRHKQQEATTLIHQTADDLQPGDPAYGYKTGNTELGPGEITEAKLQEQKDHGEPKATRTDIATQALTRPDAMKDASPGLKDKLAGSANGGYDWSPDAEFRQFKAEQAPEQAKGAKAGSFFDQPVESGSEGNASVAAKATHSAAFDALAAMRHEAEGGDEKALKELTKWAMMGKDTPAGEVQAAKAPDGTDINSPDNQLKQAVALWELSKLHLSDTQSK